MSLMYLSVASPGVPPPLPGEQARFDHFTLPSGEFDHEVGYGGACGTCGHIDWRQSVLW